MKRVFFHTTLASLLALGIYILLVGFLLRGIVATMDEIFWRFLFTSVLMTIFYGVSLLYFTKIRGRLEEQQIVKDYENHPYDSIVKDFCLIIRRERAYVCCLFVISAFCFLLHTLDGYLFEAKTLGHVAFIYSPITIMGSCIPCQPVAYLVSPACCAIMYLIAVCIYRRHCYKKAAKRR
jgi:hypothetical protein